MVKDAKSVIFTPLNATDMNKFLIKNIFGKDMQYKRYINVDQVGYKHHFMFREFQKQMPQTFLIILRVSPVFIPTSFVRLRFYFRKWMLR